MGLPAGTGRNPGQFPRYGLGKRAPCDAPPPSLHGKLPGGHQESPPALAETSFRMRVRP